MYLNSDFFNQTALRPKNIHGRSLHPKKNTKDVNFQPKKISWTPLSCILRVLPCGIRLGETEGHLLIPDLLEMNLVYFLGM